MEITVIAIMCNTLGKEVYRKNVTEKIKEITGSLDNFLVIRDSRPCEYEEIEERICEEIKYDINYEFELDGEEIDDGYLEVIY